MRKALAALLLAALPACLDTTSPNNRFELDFDFSGDAGLNWTLGASDFAPADEAQVQPVGALDNLPDPLPQQSALHLAGTNPGGGSFIFLKRQILDLPPGTWNVSAAVEFASNVHFGCTGDEGTRVWIKTGVSEQEPNRSVENDLYVFNIDKGDNALGGNASAVLGDIRNAESDCPDPAERVWGIRSTSLGGQTLTVAPDQIQGGLWFWVGIESDYVGRSEIYLTRLFVRFIRD